MTTVVPNIDTPEARRLMARRRQLDDAVREAYRNAERFASKYKALGVNPLAGKTDADRAAFAELDAAYKAADKLQAELDEVAAEVGKLIDRSTGSSTSAHSSVGAWAADVASKILRVDDNTMKAALWTDPIEVPSVIEPGPVEMARNPARLVDLLVERRGLDSNVYQFLRQVARTTNAAPVADLQQKPTSTYTVQPVEDRARVIAHLSEPVPERFLMDEPELIRWLEAEMGFGVIDALENQVIGGNGDGENLTGLLNTVGRHIIGIEGVTDVLTQLRRGRTTLEYMHEVPTGWAMNPADVEMIDLLREESEGAFLVGGGLANIFGDIPRVSTTSIPAGTAVLGDWRQSRLWVRENVTLRGDRSGENFERNQIVWRAEGRFGWALLRPQAFVEIQLYDAS